MRGVHGCPCTYCTGMFRVCARACVLCAVRVACVSVFRRVYCVALPGLGQPSSLPLPLLVSGFYLVLLEDTNRTRREDMWLALALPGLAHVRRSTRVQLAVIAEEETKVIAGSNLIERWYARNKERGRDPRPTGSKHKKKLI